MQESLTPNLKKLAKLLKKKGELYIVGGYLRNFFAGVPSFDIDLASKITTDELKDALKDTEYKIKETSKVLGTCSISLGEEKWDHSTFRRETYPENGEHTPTDVEFITGVREDAKRRDFTANAIYYNITKDELLDFYDGRTDIAKKTIRCIETPEAVLKHDGLRILRMIRIACEMGFKVDKKTRAVAYKMASNVKDISSSRKFKELQLMLNAQDSKFSKKSKSTFGLDLMNKLKLWEYFGFSCRRVRFKMLPKVPVDLRFYAFVIDCIDSEKPEYHSEFIDKLLGEEGMILPGKEIDYVKTIVKGYFEALERRSNKKFFLHYYDDFPVINGLLEHKSKTLSKKYTFFYNYINNNKIAVRIKDLKISGNDIKTAYPNLEQNNYKYVLQLLLERVFDGFVINEKRRLLDEIKKII